MLRLSNHTVGHLDLLEERKFEMRLAQFVSDKVTGQSAYPLAAQIEPVRHAIAQARAFGFVTERDIATFALTSALLGPNFHLTMRGARDILEMRKTPEHRARLLAHFTRELFDILTDG